METIKKFVPFAAVTALLLCLASLMFGGVGIGTGWIVTIINRLNPTDANLAPDTGSFYHMITAFHILSFVFITVILILNGFVLFGKDKNRKIYGFVILGLFVAIIILLVIARSLVPDAGLLSPVRWNTTYAAVFTGWRNIVIPVMIMSGIISVICTAPLIKACWDVVTRKKANRQKQNKQKTSKI